VAENNTPLPRVTLTLRLPVAEESERTVKVLLQAMKDMVTSLEIPVEFDVATDYNSEGRLSVCERFIPLPGVGRSESELMVNLHRLWRLAPYCITSDVARHLWLEWKPGDADAITAPDDLQRFRSFVCEGAALGFKMSRFRPAFETAKPRDLTGNRSAALFEEAIAKPDCGVARLRLSRDLYLAWQAALPAEIETLADELFIERGLVLPPIGVVVDETLETLRFRVEWNDLRLPSLHGLQSDLLLVNESSERLRLLNINGSETMHPATGKPAALVDRRSDDACRAAGLETRDSRGLVLFMLGLSLRQAAAALVNKPLLELYLLRLKEFNAALASEVLDRFEVEFITQVVRELAGEGISLRLLIRILDLMLSLEVTADVNDAEYIVFPPNAVGTLWGTGWGARRVADLAPEHYTEFVRRNLKRFITHQHTGVQTTLLVFLLDPTIEKRLVLDRELSSDERNQLRQAVSDEIDSLLGRDVPVVLTTPWVRRRLLQELRPEFPFLRAVAYSDLSPDINIQPLARITVDDWQ
jgi:hypothetical protein